MWITPSVALALTSLPLHWFVQKLLSCPLYKFRFFAIIFFSVCLLSVCFSRTGISGFAALVLSINQSVSPCLSNVLYHMVGGWVYIFVITDNIDIIDLIMWSENLYTFEIYKVQPTALCIALCTAPCTAICNMHFGTTWWLLSDKWRSLPLPCGQYMAIYCKSRQKKYK